MLILSIFVCVVLGLSRECRCAARVLSGVLRRTCCSSCWAGKGYVESQIAPALLLRMNVPLSLFVVLGRRGIC